MNSKFKSKNGMHNRQNEKIDEKDVNLLIKNTKKRSVSETLPSTILKHLLMCPCSHEGSYTKASRVCASTGVAAFSNILSLTVASNRHLGKEVRNGASGSKLHLVTLFSTDY